MFTPASGRNSMALDQSRRTALKHLALACGLVLSSSSLSALAASFVAPTDFSRRQKALFNKDQLALLRELGELIIPTTDTPGAITAGVHEFVNHFARACATPKEQEELLAILDAIAEAAQKRFNSGFLHASKTQQLELLNQMEQAQDGFTAEQRKQLKQLKALVVFGYYTSEIGATQELAYLAIPGGYKGNFKVKDIGRAWALN